MTISARLVVIKLDTKLVRLTMLETATLGMTRPRVLQSGMASTEYTSMHMMTRLTKKDQQK